MLSRMFCWLILYRFLFMLCMPCSVRACVYILAHAWVVISVRQTSSGEIVQCWLRSSYYCSTHYNDEPALHNTRLQKPSSCVLVRTLPDKDLWFEFTQPSNLFSLSGVRLTHCVYHSAVSVYTGRVAAIVWMGSHWGVVCCTVNTVNTSGGSVRMLV